MLTPIRQTAGSPPAADWPLAGPGVKATRASRRAQAIRTCSQTFPICRLPKAEFRPFQFIKRGVRHQRVGIRGGAPHRQKPLRGLVSAVWGAFERLPIDHGRTLTIRFRRSLLSMLMPGAAAALAAAGRSAFRARDNQNARLEHMRHLQGLGRDILLKLRRATGLIASVITTPGRPRTTIAGSFDV